MYELFLKVSVLFEYTLSEMCWFLLLKKPEAYAHHLLFMYYPFRKENELKSESETYGEKLLESGIIGRTQNKKQL